MRRTWLAAPVIAAALAGWMAMPDPVRAEPREFPLEKLDLKCVSTGWGEPKWGKSIDGNPLRIAGVEYQRGLGTHANSRLVINLFGAASRFAARVGLDDEMAGSAGTVEFVVTADGEELWRSGMMRPGDAARSVGVGLKGRKELILEVTDGGDGIGSDHGDWVEASLFVTGRDPVAVWREGEAALESLRLFRRLQNGEPVLDAEETFRRVRRIEGMYGRIPGDDGLVRPLLESLRRTGGLPPAPRDETQAKPGRGEGRREVWLDEFGALGFTCGWGTPRANRSVEGNPLRIGGREFKRGIGTHAKSRFALELFGETESFSAVAGIDDEQTAERASVEFVVRGDGDVLWRSGVLKAAGGGKPLEVDLRGVRRLELEVDDAGDGIGNDHADWADAKLVVAGRAPEVVMPEADPDRRYSDIPWSRPLDRIALTWDNHVEMNRPPEEVRKSPAADRFPGKVGRDVKRVGRTVTVDLNRPFWHSTGLYAPPGEPVTLEVPEELAGRGLRVQVGCHTDTLYHLERLLRSPEIAKEFGIEAARTTVANPFGGLIYIVVPARYEGKEIHTPAYGGPASFHWVDPIVAEPAPVKVRITGAVEAPRYVKGVTSLREWKKARRIEVPFAELAGDLMVMQVPAADVRELDKPDEVVEFWDEVMRHQADLAGWEGELIPMYFTLDRQISAGGGHSGYPIMAYADWSGSLLKIAEVREKGTWGPYHELGHNHQWSDGWTFQGQGEVTVNLFSLYCNMKMSGWKIGLNDTEPTDDWLRVTSRKYHLEALRKVFSRDPKVPGKWDEADVAQRLLFHVQLIDAFGWEPVKKVIRSYRENPGYPSSEERRGGEYMVRFSRAVGRNLHPFFRGWGIAMPEGIEEQVKDMPAWLPAAVREM